jgi:alginate O-acetyltransferase complex protein AlgI
MSWKPEYIILIMISTLVDFISGKEIFKSTSKFRKKIFLWVSIVSNLGLLFTFKYWNFFSDSLRAILTSISIPLDPVTSNLLLPVGISFYTFQTLSYTIDIYRGKLEPEKHLGRFAVYVSFFPQLVAGPIERAKNLLPQFYKKHKFEYTRVTNGLKLMLWGFFKKIVVADTLASIVNMVYNSPTEYSGIPLILGTIFFAFQIYCDFSGYSDIAIGAAQVLGFKLMDNFKRPYFSQSISEFWRRWHVSLSTWFRDYVYISLGGNRVSIPRWYVNILIVFLVSGLWHGASWTFVIWGLLHGVFIVTGAITKKLKKKVLFKFRLHKVFPQYHYLIKIASTFILVTFAWILFRSNSFSDALYIISHMFTNWTLDINSWGLDMDWKDLIYYCGLIAFMEFIHIIQEHVKMREFLSDKPILIRWSLYLFILMMIILFGIFDNTTFIYLQF